RQDLQLAATDRAGRAQFGDRRGRVGQVEDQDARIAAFANAAQRGVERRLEGQIVVELQFADDALDAVERCLVLQDRDYALAVGASSGRGGGADCACCSHGVLPDVPPVPAPGACVVGAAIGPTAVADGNCTLSVR